MMMFIRDALYALRSFKKQPLTVGTAIVALAIGISAVTVSFGFLKGVMLSPLPYKDAEHLAVLYAVHPSEDNGKSQLAVPLPFIDSITNASTITSLCGILKVPAEYLATYGEAHDTLAGITVTSGFFKTLAVPPQLGRPFSADDELPSAPRVVIITQRLWQRRFCGDSNVLGSAIYLDKVPHIVIGVMPQDFSFSIEMLGADNFARAWGIELRDPDLIFPVQRTLALSNDWEKAGFLAIARLRPGTCLQTATSQVDWFMQEAIRKHRPDAVGAHAGTISLLQSITARSYSHLLLLMTTAVLIALIVCANVSSLLVGRAIERRKEFALRASLGASESRLLRQLTVEGIVLAIPACILGVLLTDFVVNAVTASALVKIPRIEGVHMDMGVLGFAAMCALILGITVSVVPGLYSLRTNLQTTLNEGGKDTSATTGTKLQSILVVIQIGLALAVLVGATLLTRTLIRINAVDLGFEPRGVIVSKRIAFNKDEKMKARYNTPGKRLIAVEEFTSRIARLPEVAEVAVTDKIPVREFPWSTKSIIENMPEPVMLNYSVASPDYIKVMKIPLLRGRFITEQDRQGSVLVGAVNEAFVRDYAANGNPIGMRIKRIEKKDVSGIPWINIVGVVADSQTSTVGGSVEPLIYCPLAQVDFDYVCLSIRTIRDSHELREKIRDSVASVDGDFQMAALHNYGDVIKKQSSAAKFVAIAGILFGVVVTILAVSGSYAVTAQWISRRLHEIGVRMALGARPIDIFILVLRRGIRLLLLGSLFGIVAGLAANMYIANNLYVFNLTAKDWPSFVIAFLFLALVTIFVCMICARRAASVNPMDILRNN